jgi:hypothetical protein
MGRWVELPCDRLVATRRATHADLVAATILLEFTHIERDLWNILTLIEHLDWMQSAAVDGVLDRAQWFVWPALDIEHFHNQRFPSRGRTSS